MAMEEPVQHDFNAGELVCVVGKPQKENDGTKDAFVSYLVSTESDFKAFSKPSFSVRRRFTDFLFLFKHLSRDYPAAAVPPLPDKHKMEYVRGDRFGQDFTNRRAYSLHRFIKRLTLHPVLRRAPLLLLFLETSDWNMVMRNRSSSRNGSSSSFDATSPGGPNSPLGPGGSGGGGPGGGGSGGGGSGGGGGVFDTFTDTFLNAFSKVHKPDKRFIEVLERSNKLDEDLGHVEKIVSRVSRRQSDLETDYGDLATQTQKLATLEPNVETELATFAASVQATATGWKGLKEQTDQNYLSSLRDMQSYIGALKLLLRTREQKQLDFEGLTDYLTKAAADRDTLASQHGSSGVGSGPSAFLRAKIEDVRGVDHEQARRERLRKLEMQIERLTAEVESAKKTTEAFDEETVKEVEDFERIKAVEFRDTLGGLADAHVGFFGGVVEEWERFLRDVEKEGG